LDISVNADAALFEKYGIKTGAASLAEEKDKPLYAEIQAFPNVAYLAGGATQNSIRGFAWMNPVKNKAHMIGCVGDDENAQLLKTSAEAAGVKPHYNISNKGNSTGRCAVLVNSDKERSLVADLSAANDYDHGHFMSAEIQELVKEVDIFYSACFFLTVSPQTQIEIGKHCLATNKIFAINISAVFIVDFFWDQLNSVLPYADYVLCNEVEAAAFAKKSGWEEGNLEAAAENLSRLPKEGSRPRTVVFTNGPRPTIVALEGEAKVFPVPPIDQSKIVDTNGAGDAFVGGFLAGLALGKTLETAVLAGNTAGGIVIQREGPSYPETCDFVWDEYQ